MHSLTPNPSPKGEGSIYIQDSLTPESLTTPLSSWRGVGGEALLAQLLCDHTTGGNILWCTHDYESRGEGYQYADEIRQELITGGHGTIIKPRVLKSKEAQSDRVKDMAEVFTPSWVVKMMVDYIAPPQPSPKGEGVRSLITIRCLELTCGEAPFLVSRYDATTGEPIAINERVGVLDRKLRMVSEQQLSDDDWLAQVRLAFQSTYGYEWQGDSLLLARENLLFTFIDYYEARFGVAPETALLQEFADVISWNLWQMDGLSYCIPREKTVVQPQAQLELFAETPAEAPAPLCIIKDWQAGKTVKVIDIKRRQTKNQDIMKFDVIIGNPPYQEEVEGDNKQFATPVYNLFIDESQRVGKTVELIHPARFLFNAGATPKKWNNKMLKDEHLKVLKYISNSSDAFPNTNINGGIVITYWDWKRTFTPIDSFTPYDCLRSIRDKVVRNNFESFSDIVYPRDLYRFKECLYQDHPTLEGRQSKGHKYDVGSNIMDLFKELFEDEKPQNDSEYSRLLGRYNNERAHKWIKKKYLSVPENFDSYKVVIAKADGAAGQIGKPEPAQICGRPVIGMPADSQTASFISIGNFKELNSAEICSKYIQTKFARALLGVLKVTQSLTKDVWAYVPLQDFTSSSDIDWSKSIAEIDEQLFDKYGLDEQERNFIRAKVKEMN